MLRSSSTYLLHATYYEPYFQEWLGNNPYVITVHDMIYEKLPEFFSKEDRELIFEQKKKVVTQADRVIAISQNTKKDIIELLHIAPEKIDVIYHGTNIQKPTQKFLLHFQKDLSYMLVPDIPTKISLGLLKPFHYYHQKIKTYMQYVLVTPSL